MRKPPGAGKVKALVCSALVVLAGMAGPVLAQDVPVVKLQYWFFPFDDECEKLTKLSHAATGNWPRWEIKKEWKDDLHARVAAFQGVWNSEADALLGTAMLVVGKPFPHREMIATLTLCSVMSMSGPLIINMRRFLQGPMGGQPASDMLFASLVFHELLHTYVVAHRPPTTPLLIEHQAALQLPVARNHVHLYALMQVVYRKLGRAADLQSIKTFDTSGSSAAYEQAWELVEKTGAERWVAELKGP